MRPLADHTGGQNPKAKYVHTDAHVIITGIGKTKSYELLANGTFRAVKVGKRTLWDLDHNLAALAAMPSA